MDVDFLFCTYWMKQARTKYTKLRKFEYLQEKAFEVKVAVKTLKRQLISFSTVLIIPMKD